MVGTLCDKAAAELGLPAGIAIGSGVIDAYAGWIGTVGAKVNLESDQLSSDVAKNDKTQAFSRLAAVAGTSTCHLAMSPNPVFVPGVWGPYRDTIQPGYWMAEGGQSATGELLKHVIETHPAFNQAVSIAESYNANIYEYLNEHLKEMAQEQKALSVSYLGRHFFFYGDLCFAISLCLSVHAQGGGGGETNQILLCADYIPHTYLLWRSFLCNNPILLSPGW